MGAGASFEMQEDSDGIKHPISYFSKKAEWIPEKAFNGIEKEALALLLAVKFYDVYISSCPFPIRVYTDHNPLVFINKMKNVSIECRAGSVVQLFTSLVGLPKFHVVEDQHDASWYSLQTVRL